MTVVAYVPDLMDRSKVDAAAGQGVVHARRPAQLAELVGPSTTVVLVDVGRPGVLDALGAVVATDVAVVGFASHVERDLIESARAIGVDEVLPRSAFFTRLPELVAR